MQKIGLVAKALIQMSRPAQLLLISMIYLYGSTVAWVRGFQLDWNTFSVGLVVILIISASIHYTNEYADYETDALTERTPFSGGSGALPGSGIPRHVALNAAWIALIIGSLLGLISLALGRLSIPALCILFLGAFGGWMYSLPPLALAWRGWGELENAVLGGIALPLYAYVVQSGKPDLQAALIFIPFGILVFLNLLATTWADRQADAAVGKFTLATRWSIVHLRSLYLVVASSIFIYLGSIGHLLFPPMSVWGTTLIIPLLIWGFFAYTRQHSPLPSVAAMVMYLLIQSVVWGGYSL